MKPASPSLSNSTPLLTAPTGLMSSWQSREASNSRTRNSSCMRRAPYNAGPIRDNAHAATTRRSQLLQLLEQRFDVGPERALVGKAKARAEHGRFVEQRGAAGGDRVPRIGSRSDQAIKHRRGNGSVVGDREFRLIELLQRGVEVVVRLPAGCEIAGFVQAALQRLAEGVGADRGWRRGVGCLAADHIADRDRVFDHPVRLTGRRIDRKSVV